MIVFIIIFVIVLIPIYSYNKNKFTIAKGKHSALIEFCPHFGITEMERTVIFSDSCLYVDKSGENDWNKVFGFSYGNHHKNSIRVGWRCSKPNKLSLGLYYYINGKRNHFAVKEIKTNTPYTVKLKVTQSDISIAVSKFNEPTQIIYAKYKVEPKFGTMFTKLTPKWGYYLYPYFGGQEKAPYDMKIRIFKK